jgi:hypothetical protein
MQPMKWYSYVILFAFTVLAGLTVAYITKMINEPKTQKTGE